MKPASDEDILRLAVHGNGEERKRQVVAAYEKLEDALAASGAQKEGDFYSYARKVAEELSVAVPQGLKAGIRLRNDIIHPPRVVPTIEQAAKACEALLMAKAVILGALWPASVGSGSGVGPPLDAARSPGASPVRSAMQTPSVSRMRPRQGAVLPVRVTPRGIFAADDPDADYLRFDGVYIDEYIAEHVDWSPSGQTFSMLRFHEDGRVAVRVLPKSRPNVVIPKELYRGGMDGSVPTVVWGVYSFSPPVYDAKKKVWPLAEDALKVQVVIDGKGALLFGFPCGRPYLTSRLCFFQVRVPLNRMSNRSLQEFRQTSITPGALAESVPRGVTYVDFEGDEGLPR